MTATVSASEEILPTTDGRSVYLVLSACILANFVDGFDVMAIAFAGPALVRDWGLAPAELGLLFSSGLAGVTLGSLVLSPLADRFGRRPLTIGCLTMMSCTMLGSGLAPDVNVLALLRFLTGLGVGGILATLNSLAAETAPPGRTNLAISLFAAGYPLGSMAGGAAALFLIEDFGWASIFYAGGVLTALVTILVLLVMPVETRRLNPLLVLATPLRPVGLRALALISSFFFLHMTVVFFLLNWLPRLVEMMGYSADAGVAAAMVVNLGNLAGGLSFGPLADRLSWLRVAKFSFLILALAMVAMGAMNGSQTILYAMAGIIGFFMGGAMTSLFALAPVLFDPDVRVGRTGIALGIGRFGAMLGPALAGFGLAVAMTPPILIFAFAVFPAMIVLMLHKMGQPARLLENRAAS